MMASTLQVRADILREIEWNRRQTAALREENAARERQLRMAEERLTNVLTKTKAEAAREKSSAGTRLKEAEEERFKAEQKANGEADKVKRMELELKAVTEEKAKNFDAFCREHERVFELFNQLGDIEDAEGGHSAGDVDLSALDAEMARLDAELESIVADVGVECGDEGALARLKQSIKDLEQEAASVHAQNLGSADRLVAMRAEMDGMA